MLLKDLQQHFNNNNVYHAARYPNMSHDIYVNHSNGLQFTIPISEDSIPDEYASFACFWLQIEGIDGKPYNPETLSHMPYFMGSTPPQA